MTWLWCLQLAVSTAEYNLHFRQVLKPELSLMEKTGKKKKALSYEAKPKKLSQNNTSMNTD